MPPYLMWLACKSGPTLYVLRATTMDVSIMYTLAERK